MPHSGGRPSARAPSVARAHAPASCQTKTQQQFVTHRAATRALPPSLGLRSVLFTVPFVFVRWRFSEERKQAGNGRKGKNNEIRRDQEQYQRGIQLSGGSTGLRTERHFDTVSQRDGPIPQLLLSFGNIMLIARQRAKTCCYTSLESMNMRLYALLEASDGEYHIC